MESAAQLLSSIEKVRPSLVQTMTSNKKEVRPNRYWQQSEGYSITADADFLKLRRSSNQGEIGLAKSIEIGAPRNRLSYASPDAMQSSTVNLKLDTQDE